MCANKLLLAEQDLEYSRALAKAISNLNKGIEITIKKLDALLEFQEYDLILTGGFSEESIKNIVRNRCSFEYFVILSEDRPEDLKIQSQYEGGQCWRIYKYQHLDMILSDLNIIIGSLSGRKKIYRNDIETGLIGFFSCSGGAGSTSLTIAASRELARYHSRRVLYLSFEEIPVTELYFGTGCARNISDYLYFLLEKKNEAVCSCLDSFLYTDEYGVDTFLPSEGRNDLNLLSQDELERFIQSIAGSKRYDYIMLDLKNDLAEQTLRLIELCSRLILIRSNDPASLYKTEKLIRTIEKAEILNRQKDCLMVLNRSSENGSSQVSLNDNRNNNTSPHQKKHLISVDEDENSFHCRGNRMEIDLCRSFGIGVKKIVEELLISKN